MIQLYQKKTNFTSKISHNLLLLLICTTSTLYARDPSPEAPDTPKEGNLALPSAQQPGPLFGFGQNLVEKGDTLGYLFLGSSRGCNQRFNDLLPVFLYGIS